MLCVASDLRFTDIGILPGLEEGSLAENLARLVRAPVAAGLQSLSAPHLSAAEPPDEDALVCGDDPGAKELVLELAGRLVGGRAVDVGPLANSRALEGMTAVILNVNRSTASTRVCASPACRDRLDHAGRGAAGDPRGRRPRRADRRACGAFEDGDVLVVAQKAVSKAEGRVVRLAEVEPSERGAASSRAATTRGSIEVILRESARIVRTRPPLVIAETRHGFVCASAGVDASNAPEPDTRRAPARGPGRLGRPPARARCASRPAPRSA